MRESKIQFKKVIEYYEIKELLMLRLEKLKYFLSFLMEEKIVFEHFLYGDGNEIHINDMEFVIDRILMLPKIRPHKLETAVSLCAEYCSNTDFHQKILEKSKECPALIYQLFKRGVFELGEVEPFLRSRDVFVLCYYFRQNINDFESFIMKKDKPYDFDRSFFDNSQNTDLFIEYGFLPSSIEYCLKYDVIDDLINNDNYQQKAKWSPFEWSIPPKYLDLLSFSGFFGSIKCFKHLLLKGFEINDKVLSMVVCSGCLDLFHLCQVQQSITKENVFYASMFCHLPLLVFLVENGADLSAKSDCVGVIHMNRLPLILLLNMVTLVFLNI